MILPNQDDERVVGDPVFTQVSVHTLVATQLSTSISGDVGFA
jgi:hypothetical protein